MKKTLITSVLAVALAGSAFAQGTVTFIASGGARPISFIDAGATNSTKLAVGAPATIPGPGGGTLNIAIYGASQGTVVPLGPGGVPNLNGWVLAAPILHNITAIPGNVVGTTITMDATLGAPGGTVQMYVVGWAGAFADWQSAVNGATYLGWVGSPASNGGAFGWVQATGTATTAQVMVTGVGGFNGLTLTAVPEPGTIALGGLGVAALLLFRRRK